MGSLRKSVGVAAIAAAMSTAGLVAMAPQAAASPAPCGPAARACVALGANAAWLMNGGAVTYGSVPITSGKPGYRTPKGSFKVTYKDIDHWSHSFDGPMPFSVFFTTTGVAFHEGSLSQLSHGCIHLSPEAARVFYDNLAPGDVVEVVA
ncbi:L,D-transpeptidase [Actinokineospora terrae]|uniref:L,D-transpeptidase catalytic domain n=1 Tax=Actinokineospora terrae TaxID=155974 RepID=A0A1H9X1J6_9PSEU|nr:L,D-transpeptidase [Actinokineospora terrae]SES39747.1 L,D-transpeptidase catalytic domain [Actinokineospora terrae]